MSSLNLRALVWAVILRAIILATLVGGLSAQTPKSGSSEDIDRILAWLPEDAETVIVAQDSFRLPMRDPDSLDSGLEAPDVITAARGSVAGPLGAAEHGELLNRLQGRVFRFAVLAARGFANHVGTPLGMIRYQGCGVYAFELPLTPEVLGGEPATAIAGEPVWISKGLQRDPVTQADEGDDYFASLLESDLVVVCTDRDFLQSLITRKATAADNRALPNTLPEWKQVNRSAPVWAVRHFAKSAPDDPTHPAHDNSLGIVDPQAVGVVAEVDTETIRLCWISNTAKNPWQVFADAPYLQSEKGDLKTLKDNGVWELFASTRGVPGFVALLLLMGVMGFAVNL